MFGVQASREEKTPEAEGRACDASIAVEEEPARQALLSQTPQSSPRRCQPFLSFRKFQTWLWSERSTGRSATGQLGSRSGLRVGLRSAVPPATDFKHTHKVHTANTSIKTSTKVSVFDMHVAVRLCAEVRLVKVVQAHEPILATRRKHRPRRVNSDPVHSVSYGRNKGQQWAYVLIGPK
jgi:hypothetical protein